MDQTGASIRTGLRVDRPESIMFGRNRSMHYISMHHISTYVSDVADDATPMTVVRPLLDEGFTNLDTAFTALLGTVTSAESGHFTAPECQCDLPSFEESEVSGMGG
ncbi:hypothetical protein ACFT1A_26305 [Rhodococcus sp. NPDC057135]|uniref:hypothetical protein n=1 Tax=Rhodococcus sp. NPDC057135 TaxID=3346028 RepID=UPI003632E2DC